MANPKVVKLKKDTWVKVAENVTSGFIKQLNRIPRIYLETYRLTGDTTAIKDSEGVPWSTVLEIESSAPIDVYVKSEKISGKVRVDV